MSKKFGATITVRATVDCIIEAESRGEAEDILRRKPWVSRMSLGSGDVIQSLNVVSEDIENLDVSEVEETGESPTESAKDND